MRIMQSSCNFCMSLRCVRTWNIADRVEQFVLSEAAAAAGGKDNCAERFFYCFRCFHGSEPREIKGRMIFV